jgi:tetratricopeptide (TPR) repeat protein
MTAEDLGNLPGVIGPLRQSPLSFLCGLLILASSIVLTGCLEIGPTMFLNGRDSDIKDATQTIESARDDAQRAKGYSSRGAAYSEKARYSRIMKLIRGEEYERLFNLAIKDHDQAIALNPKSTEGYFNRAQAYYDRGSLDLLENKNGKAWFNQAALDFEQATERDPKNSLAFDRLGLTYESSNEADKAIRAYTQEMALDPSLGKARLATAYCYFGFRHQQQNEFAAAAMAYEKSTEFGTPDDKTCPHEPYSSMVAIYTGETHEYDKAWKAVGRAMKAGRLMPPELLLRLTKESGRSN